MKERRRTTTERTLSISQCQFRISDILSCRKMSRRNKGRRGRRGREGG
jgi:hypothetical protein